MKISELARATQISVETVRFYQREFLVSIPVQTTGIRQYNREHIEQIQFIKNAKLAGFSLAEIKQLTQYDAVKDKGAILALSEQKQRALLEKIAELQNAKTFIQRLIDDCKKSDSVPCPILKTLKSEL